MKTSQDPRHKRRQDLLQNLFSYSFRPEPIADIEPIIAELPTIDNHIHVSAPEWPIDKIAKIDLAILRLAIYEMLVEKKEPSKVIIDEAVELAKEYGNDHSSRFINGVLGTILKTIKN